MQRFKEFWATVPTPSKVLALVVLLALLLVVGGAVGGFVSHIKDRAFIRERDSLIVERHKKEEMADAAEERARNAEAEKVKYQLAYEIAGKDAAKAMEKVTDAEKKYDAEIERIDADVDACTRYADLRATLGLKPAPCQSASPGGQ